MIFRLLPLYFMFLSFSLPACGYALVGKGSSLPADVKSVSIPLFENRTGEPDLDTIVTRVVKEHFIRDGRLKVESVGAADTKLSGVVESYNIRPLAYDEANNVTEYMVNMAVSVTHSYTRTGELLKKERINTNWRYVVDPSITVTESQRLDAIESAAENVAESVVSLVIESF